LVGLLGKEGWLTELGLAAGFEAVPPVAGPMGRSVEDLVFITKVPALGLISKLICRFS